MSGKLNELLNNLFENIIKDLKLSLVTIDLNA